MMIETVQLSECPDPLPADIDCPRLREILLYWQGKCARHELAPCGAPWRNNFDPLLEVPQLTRIMTLIDTPDPYDLKAMTFRLVGTEIVNFLGYDLTGKSMRELHDRDWRRLENQYRFTIMTQRPHLVRRRLPSVHGETKKIGYERILLPMTRTGDFVDLFLAAFTFYNLHGAPSYSSVAETLPAETRPPFFEPEQIAQYDRLQRGGWQPLQL